MRRTQTFRTAAVTALLATTILLVADAPNVEARQSQRRNGHHGNRGRNVRYYRSGRIQAPGTGTIRSVSGGTIVIQEGHTLNSYHMAPLSRIVFSNGAEGSLSDIKRGMRVTVVVGMSRDELSRIELISAGGGGDRGRSGYSNRSGGRHNRHHGSRGRSHSRR